MDVSGQLSVPAALISRQIVWYLLDRRLGGAESRSGSFGTENNLYSLPGIQLSTSILRPSDTRNKRRAENLP